MTNYLLTIAVLGGLNALLAISYNLVLGYAGLLSVAHPMFYAIGAYSSALLALKVGIPIPVAILLGAAVSAIASLALSLCSQRVSGDYFVVITLGFQLAFLLILGNTAMTGGASGLSSIPSLIEGPYRAVLFAVLVYGLVLGTGLVVRFVMRGSYGRAVTAMRNDEEAFAALGRDHRRMKIAIFAAGSGIAGLAGALYAHFFLYLAPSQFGIFGTTILLTMVVVGGAATVWGPVLGAFLLTGLPQAISFLDLPVSVMAPLQGVLYSLLVLVFLFVRPQGIMGGARHGGGLEAWRGATDPKSPAQSAVKRSPA